MVKLRRMLALLLTVLLAVPVLPVWASDADSKIQVSVSIYETIDESYPVQPLQLSCEAGAAAFDLLDLLRAYAYIENYQTVDQLLIEVSFPDGRVIRTPYGDPESSWALYKNGEPVSPADYGEPLSDGDELVFSYLASEAEKEYHSWEEEAERLRGASIHISDFWKSDYNALLTKAASWLRQNDKTTAALVSLGAAGISVEYRYLASALAQITETEQFADAEELAKAVLSVTFCGISARNVSGRNLIDELGAMSGMTVQDAAWTLLALDSNNYTLSSESANTRDFLLNLLLGGQQEDGGFSNGKDGTGSVSLTALSLTALALYLDDAAVRQAVNAGLSYLADAQDSDGSFREGDAPSGLLTAQVVTALSSLGILPDDARFTRNGGNILEALLRFQTESGGFSNLAENEPDAATTRQCILALVSIKNGGNPYLLRNAITGEGSPVIAQGSSQDTLLPALSSDVGEMSDSQRLRAGGLGLLIGVLLGVMILFTAIFIIQRMQKKQLEDEIAGRHRKPKK